MYLAMPLDRPEYMRIHRKNIPKQFIDKYNLHDKFKNDFIYLRIIRGMYGLPRAGILANKLLRSHLEPFGYYEVTHTLGL